MITLPDRDGVSPHDTMTLDGAKSALRSHAKNADIDPLTNSVFALAVHYFQRLQNGSVTIDELDGLAGNVAKELIVERADRFRRQHRLGDDMPYPERVADRLKNLAVEGFAPFAEAVGKAVGGIVFTGHPTFALPKSVRNKFAAYATASTDANRQCLLDVAAEDSEDWANGISLELEHNEVQEALHHAQRAMDAYLRRIIAIARDAFPDQWRELAPALPTVASWVGYDLDGRTDIQWTDSVSFRLHEKSVQLARYAAKVHELIQVHGGDGQLSHLHDRLKRASTLANAQKIALAEAQGEPQKLVAAATLITGPHPDRLTSSAEITDVLSKMIDDSATSDGLAAELIALRSMVETLQLGTGRIHLRINAAQMNSVIKRDLGIQTDGTNIGRVAITALAEKARTATRQDVTFADLYFEQTTARRQFMMCQVLLDHVDEGSPIRFLIAESENPATVLSALYLARLHGVAHNLDISPLFETPDALVAGARFMERLLEEDAFVQYVSERGYMSIQLGFSDAGRFVGQVAADMAIERLHNLIGRALADKACGFDLLIFNTHGESMGRGAYPGTFTDRLDHVLTPWTRAQNTARGIHIRHEVSFQGGDGFLHFANPELADATYSALCQHYLMPADEEALKDPFYHQTDFVWDFYRSLKAWQQDLLNRPEYDNLLSDFAGGFLVRAGSRRTRRRGARGPRALRAISHNATLHQLGVPLNVSGGIGSAMPNESDQLIDLIDQSPRMAHLVNLSLSARMVTSVPSLRAYAAVYSPYLWTGLAHQATGEQQQLYIRVHEALETSETTSGIMKLGDRMAIDLLAFDDLLGRIKSAPTIDDRHEHRLPLHVLHAIRQALMMRALTLTATLPTFSDRHGVDVGEIIEMVHAMLLDDAVIALRRIFPASRDPDNAFEALYPAGETAASPDAQYGYDAVHRDVIEPLWDIAQKLRSISLSLCHAYGAYG